MAAKTLLVYPQNTVELDGARPMFAYIADDESETLRMLAKDSPTDESTVLDIPNLDFGDLETVLWAGAWNQTKPTRIVDHESLDEAIAAAQTELNARSAE